VRFIEVTGLRWWAESPPYDAAAQVQYEVRNREAKQLRSTWSFAGKAITKTTTGITA
jgi:hypothetical protein